MGRDKPKKYGKMNYQQKSVYHDKLAKKYNISKDDFNTAQGGGGGRYDNINQGAYEKAIKNAIRNDFDYRTSAQHMDDIKGEADFDDFVEYERGAKKLHRQAGNGGEYSSIKDITGVTNNLVNDAQRLLKDKIDALSTNDDEQTNTSITPELTDEPYEPSPELVKQAGILADWEEGYGAGGNLSPYKSSFQDMAFNPAEANPYRATTDVNEFAQQNLAKYTGGVKDIFQFRPTIA
jgi:hypothetical protein